MKNGIIITFYSFKKGVGRTFLLANSAATLAQWGFKILCIDWDLEAPGLHQFFSEDATNDGLLELFSNIDANSKINISEHES